MKLVIEIKLDGNDLEETDFDVFLQEAKDATAINIEVGRPISEDDEHVARMCSVSAENFTARIER